MPLDYTKGKIARSALRGESGGSTAVLGASYNTVVMSNQYSVVIEKGADGVFVASVPQLPGCHTQAESLDELMDRIREAILLWLDVNGEPESIVDFVGVQRVTVAA